MLTNKDMLQNNTANQAFEACLFGEINKKSLSTMLETEVMVQKFIKVSRRKR